MSETGSSGPTQSDKAGNVWRCESLSEVKDNPENISHVALFRCDDGEVSLLVKNIQEEPIWQDKWGSQFSFFERKVHSIRGNKNELRELFDKVTINKSLEIFGVLSKIDYRVQMSYPMMEVVSHIINAVRCAPLNEKAIEKNVKDFLDAAREVSVSVGLHRIKQEDEPLPEENATQAEK